MENETQHIIKISEKFIVPFTILKQIVLPIIMLLVFPPSCLSQDITKDRCTILKNDTVIMIDEVGGHCFIVCDDYVVRHPNLKLNIDSVKIVFYRSTYSGADCTFEEPSANLPKAVINNIKKIDVLYLWDFLFEYPDKKISEYNAEFKIFIKHCEIP